MFAVEKDEFCSNEKIDEKWTELAKSLINENMDEKEEMLKDFRDRIKADPELVELSQSDLIKDDEFLIRSYNSFHSDMMIF